MKKHIYSFFILALLCISSFGQTKPKVIYLCFNKTVHLLFNTKVVYVDVGIDDILWKMEDNMTKLATKVDNFPETSLVVKTSDEIIYSFILRYAVNSDTLIYNIPESYGISSNKSQKRLEIKEEKDSITTAKEEKDTLWKACKFVLSQSQNIKDVDDIEKDVFVSLTNIFVYQDKLFFHFKVFNWSNINYDVDCFDLTVTDKKRIKVSTIQPIIIKPIFTYNNFDRLPAQEMKEIVIVTKKFTVPDKKSLQFELKEIDGGRNFLFTIDKNLIYKAPALVE
jgi:conjugative transposon TraN protein